MTGSFLSDINYSKNFEFISPEYNNSLPIDWESIYVSVTLKWNSSKRSILVPLRDKNKKIEISQITKWASEILSEYSTDECWVLIGEGEGELKINIQNLRLATEAREKRPNNKFRKTISSRRLHSQLCNGKCLPVQRPIEWTALDDDADADAGGKAGGGQLLEEIRVDCCHTHKLTHTHTRTHSEGIHRLMHLCNLTTPWSKFVGKNIDLYGPPSTQSPNW